MGKHGSIYVYKKFYVRICGRGLFGTYLCEPITKIPDSIYIIISKGEKGKIFIDRTFFEKYFKKSKNKLVKALYG